MGMVLSIEDALQTISRSQASGMLKVGNEVTAVFVGGSLSHIASGSQEQVTGICGLLNGAGCLADPVVELVQKANVAVEQLGQLLVSRQYLSNEEFQRAKKAYQMNRVLGLVEDEDVQAEFSPDRSVKHDEQSLHILASELLLDVVGLRSAGRELFAQQDSQTRTFALADEYELQGLTVEEVILVKLLQHSEGALTAAELEQRGLMSRAELYVALRVLLERGVVIDGSEVGTSVDPETELNDEEADEILSDLFDDELEATLEEEAAAPQRQEAEGFWSDDEGDEELAGSFVSETTFHDDLLPPAEFEPESNRWADNEAERGEVRAFSIGMRLRMLNYRLTETSAVTHVVLVVTIVYLVLLAHLLPSLLRGWFDAVSNFTHL